MSSFNFIKNNISEIGVYALLDWLELHYKTKIHENYRLDFKSRVSMASASSDVHSLEQVKNKVNVVFNNIGLIGIQSGMSLYIVEEVIKNSQLGDTVLPDFVDIFNHRIVELYYKLRKINYLHYYNDKLRANIINNFVNIKKFDNLTLRYFKQNRSAFFIHEMLKKVLGEDITVHIKKAQPRKIKISPLKKRILGSSCVVRNKIAPLKKNILGSSCVVRNKTIIVIHCLLWATYEKLMYQDFLSEIYALLELDRVKFEIKVTLERQSFQKIKLGYAKLGFGLAL